jgi:hypothetical protein
VPLSEHEQRLFDQIEQSLAKDPKFASAVRASDPKHHAKRRVYASVLLGVVGVVGLVIGAARSSPLIGVGGFVVMLAAAAFGLRSARRGSNVPLRSVGGTATRTTRRTRLGFVDRLEERWRNRGDNIL